MTPQRRTPLANAPIEYLSLRQTCLSMMAYIRRVPSLFRSRKNGTCCAIPTVTNDAGGELVSSSASRKEVSMVA